MIYIQQQIDEINRLIKDTDLNQSEIAEAVNKKFPKEEPLKPHNVTHYAKKYFNIKKRAPLTPAYKKRFTFAERKGKLLKDILAKEDLVESIEKDVANKLTKEEIVDKYRIGGDGEELLPSGVKQIGKNTLEEVYEELDIVRGRADLLKVDINTPENKINLKNIKKFFEDPKLSRAEAYEKTGLSRAQVDKLIKRYKEAKGEPLFINREELGVRYEGAGQKTNVFKQKTKELQRFQTFLKKYKNKPLRSGTVELAKAIKKFGTNPIGFQLNLSMLRKIYKGQERPGFKIDNEVKSVIGKFPVSTALTADVLIEAGYTPKQIEKLNKAQAIIRKLDTDQASFLNQLEHKVPKSVASELLNQGRITASQYKDIVGRITPVTTDLNQWKKQYDMQRLTNLKNYLSSNMEADDLKKFNEVENDIIKKAKKISGGYDIGKIEINPNGKINLISPDEIFKTKEVKGIGPGSRALIDYYKNIKYHNILAKKYNANKNDSAFGTLKAYRAGKDVPVFDEKITKEISKLSSSEDFTKYLTKNTDGPLFKGLTKLVSPQMRSNLLRTGKIGGAVSLATLIPSMLLAETPDDTETKSTLPEAADDDVTYMQTGFNLPNDTEFGDPDTWDMKVGQFIEESPFLSTFGAAGTALQASQLKKPTTFGKFAKQIAAFPVGAAIKGVGTAVTPLGLTGLTGATFDIEDPLSRATVGLDLAFAKDSVDIAKLLGSKATSNPAIQSGVTRLLNLGLSPTAAMRAARFASPLGMLLLAGEGGYQFYQALEDEKARIAAMSPEERQAFEEEQTAAAYMGEAENFAYGGRVGMKIGGDPKDKRGIKGIESKLPIDPNMPQDPGRRNFLEKMGIGSLGIGALMTGAIKFGPEAVKAVKKATPDFSSTNVPAIVEELYSVIKNFGKQTEYPKPGSGDVKYEFGPYKMEEGPGGYNITKTNEGEYSYSEEYFGVYRDPETGAIEYEELTVRPDMDGKLKDVDYGVDAQTYREIGEDLSKTTGQDVYKVIAEEDIKGVLDDGGVIMDQGVLKSGK